MNNKTELTIEELRVIMAALATQIENKSCTTSFRAYKKIKKQVCEECGRKMRRSTDEHGEDEMYTCWECYMDDIEDAWGHQPNKVKETRNALVSKGFITE